MSMKCRLCGRGLNQIGGYLQRVNEKGTPGVWECSPMCDVDLPAETVLLMAVEGEEVDELRGEVKPFFRTMPPYLESGRNRNE